MAQWHSVRCLEEVPQEDGGQETIYLLRMPCQCQVLWGVWYNMRDVQEAADERGAGSSGHQQDESQILRRTLCQRSTATKARASRAAKKWLSDSEPSRNSWKTKTSSPWIFMGD